MWNGVTSAFRSSIKAERVEKHWLQSSSPFPELVVALIDREWGIFRLEDALTYQLALDIAQIHTYRIRVDSLGQWQNNIARHDSH